MWTGGWGPCGCPSVPTTSSLLLICNVLGIVPALLLLPSQDARLPVCSQLDPIVSGKSPSVLSSAMPVAAQEPIAFLAVMALARPVHEPLLHKVIVPAHGC